MVPQALMRVEKFPLNINGKVDLNVLPTPIILHSETMWRGAETPLQQTLLTILCLTFSDQKIGIDHNFYRCGGIQFSRFAIAMK